MGNFRIEARLGEGGMGEVFLARHQHLGSLAAIKVLLPEMCQKPEVVRRFFNEARAVTAIRHPSIVEIYDFEQLPDGRACIIMEYLQGETLAARLSRVHKLSIATSLLLARQVAGALAAAHARGIVHRDLKPENVFLIEDPEIAGRERIKLLDFGIARFLENGSDVSATRTGQVLGTPGYMSPEQCRGASDVDGRSDLYSLGCVLYRMLCGRPPFALDSVCDVFAHHLYFEPEPLGKHLLELPAAVEELVHKLLAKRPEDRYANASKLVEAIDVCTRRITGRLQTASEIPRHNERRRLLVPVAGPAAGASSAGIDSVAAWDFKPLDRAEAPTVRIAEPPSAVIEYVVAAAPARRLRSWMLGGALVAMVCAGLVLASVFDPPQAGGTHDLEQILEGSSGPSSPFVDQVTLQFMVEPREVREYQVRLGGRLAPTQVLTVPRSQTRLEIEISASGYQTARLTPVPLSSMVYPVTLTPLEPRTALGSLPRDSSPDADGPGRYHQVAPAGSAW